MDINLIFPFLNPGSFFLNLISIFPIILYNLLIYLTIRRYKEDFKLSRLLLITSLIALGVALATFFIPGFETSSISEEEVFILNLFTLLISLLGLILTAFVPALSLLIFGYLNSKRYKFYLLLAGTFLLAYFVFSFINFALTIILSPSVYLQNIFLYRFLSYVSLVIGLAAYAFLIVQGVLNRQSLFRNTGIIMIGVSVFVLLFSSFLFQLIFEFY
jgi:hypothetical protein